MAVYSMTGYANASADEAVTPAAALHERTAGAAPHPVTKPTVAVEMRSVNNRFLDLTLRLPDEYRGLEPALRELVAGRFKRGKVELRLSSSDGAAEGALSEPRAEQLAALARIELGVREHLPQARPLSVHEALHWCRGSAAAPVAEAQVLAVARRCVEELSEARGREGERLAAVLLERVVALRELTIRAAPLVPAAIARQQERFVQRWRETIEQAGAAETISRSALDERALNEAAAYAIRIDIAEELARLGSHLEEVARLIERGGEVGKRLEFLIQELLREANTLGSKSSSLEMTAISVDMKVAIEQLREQAMNVE